MLVCGSLHNFAHETAGAARTRSSLRPLIGGQGDLIAKLGRKTPRDREGVFTIIASEAKQSSFLFSQKLDCFVARAPRNDEVAYQPEPTPALTPSFACVKLAQTNQ